MRLHARIIALLLTAAACRDGTSPQPAPGTLSVTPDAATLAVGDSARLTARATSPDGSPQTDAAFTWTTSSSGVASVDGQGNVRAKSAGEATITASSEGRRASARVTVVGASSDVPTLVWLEMTPRSVDLGSVDSATVVVATEGAVTSAAVVRPGGLPDLAFRSAGPDRWSARIAVADLTRGYQRGWTHNYVGRLTFNGARTGGFIVSANVRDADMPEVPVQALAADAQASPHVVNLRWDELYLGQIVPRPVVQRFYQLFGDEYDWIATVEPVTSPHNRFFAHVRSTVEGTGVPKADVGAAYGSAARLKGLIHFPLDAYFDMGYTAAVHEMGHQFVSFLGRDSTLARGVPHWPISTLAYGVMGWSQAGGEGGEFSYRVDAQGDGTYRLTRVATAREYNRMELYLMGLLPADSVGEYMVFENQDQRDQVRSDGILHGPVRTITAADVVRMYGPRAPAYGHAQTDYRAAVIVLSRGRLLTPAEMAFFDHMAARGEAATELPFAQGGVYGTTKPFGPATGGRARLTTRLR